MQRYPDRRQYEPNGERDPRNTGRRGAGVEDYPGSDESSRFSDSERGYDVGRRDREEYSGRGSDRSYGSTQTDPYQNEPRGGMREGGRESMWMPGSGTDSNWYGQRRDMSRGEDRERQGYQDRNRYASDRGMESDRMSSDRDGRNFQESRSDWEHSSEYRDRDSAGRFTSGNTAGSNSRSTQSRGQHAGKGPKGYQKSDQRLQEEISEIFTQHSELDASEIEIKVQHGEITLSGTVDDRESKRLAEDLAEACSGVKEVHNQIRVNRGNSAGNSGSHSKGKEERSESATAGGKR
jgi:osmotically-inducible protein OsmY